ncbi:MAG TPA: hypothetical protein VMW53_12150 [archaeon]|nr:hypothetical protein [archaeon]
MERRDRWVAPVMAVERYTKVMVCIRGSSMGRSTGVQDREHILFAEV